MCWAVYLASGERITNAPSRDGSEPAFVMSEVGEHDPVRQKLSGQHVYHLGSPSGTWRCSCGLFEKFGRPKRASDPTQRNYYALASMVRDALRRGGGAEIYCCWEGEEDESVASKVRVVPSTLEDAAFDITERRLIEVVARSDPGTSPRPPVPDWSADEAPWKRSLRLIVWSGIITATGIAVGLHGTWVLGIPLSGIGLLGGLLGISQLTSRVSTFAEPLNFRTDLMSCAGDGDLARARELIGRGADVHARSESGETALMYAAREGRYEVAEYLLSVGADPLARADNGSRALEIAQSHGHTEVAALLQRAMSL